MIIMNSENDKTSWVDSWQLRDKEDCHPSHATEVIEAKYYRQVIIEHNHALRMACNFIVEKTGSCPYEVFHWDGCLKENCLNDNARCWFNYFYQLAEANPVAEEK